MSASNDGADQAMIIAEEERRHREEAYEEKKRKAKEREWIEAVPECMGAYVSHIRSTWDQFAVDLATADGKDLNGFVLHSMIFYLTRFYADEKLFEVYQEDFEEWTVDHWKLVATPIRRDFRDFLRRYGIFVKKERDIPKSLTDLAVEEEQHKWTPEEIKQQMDKEPKTNAFVTQPGSFFSKLNPFYKPPRESIGDLSTVAGKRGSPPRTHGFNDYQPILEIDTDVPVREITNLMKIYQDDKLKYGGEIYDVIDTKLQIFKDYCHKAGVGETKYHHAFSAMLKDRALQYYYDNFANKPLTFVHLVHHMKEHFENDENRQLYLAEWRQTTLPRVISENPAKSKLECLQLLFDKLRTLELSLGASTEANMRNQIMSSCQGVRECELALFSPAPTLEGLMNQLRSAVGTKMRTEAMPQQFHQSHHNSQYVYGDDDVDEYGQYWVDRTYGGRGNGRGNSRGFQSRGHSRGGGNFRGRFRGGFRQSSKTRFVRKCWICAQPGCLSTKHPKEEQKAQYEKFKASSRQPNVDHAYYMQFLADHEGHEALDDGPVDQMVADWEENMNIDDSDYDEFDENFNYTTAFGQINGPATVKILTNNAAFHAITKADPFGKVEQLNVTLFPTPVEIVKDLASKYAVENELESFFANRYSSEVFHGIMPDSGAAGVSTCGKAQYLALRLIDKSIQLDSSTAGAQKVRFGKGDTSSLGTIIVPTPIGTITFHVLPTNTPFLLCIKDMDDMHVKLDNLENLLVQGNNVVPIVRKWGHPWMLLHHSEQAIAHCHMTEQELKTIHRRFGHPSVDRLHKILTLSGLEVERKALEHLTRYCHSCQMNGRSPGRFRFTIKDDCEFNYMVIVDVMYLDGKPVLHVVDEATAFNAARFLPEISAKATWDALRLCWIDTYQGPPDFIVTDAGRNFASEEFRNNAKTMDVQVKEVPTEAHNSVGKIERYHGPLRRAYTIIRAELQAISKELSLQMAVKAINDTAGPNGLVPTLLVFGAYPRITQDSPPSPSIIERGEAVRKAMMEVRRLHAIRQVKDASSMLNGPNVDEINALPLNSDVKVWRESKGWRGPFKLIAREGQTCTVQMLRGTSTFRTTVVKPYYTEENGSASIVEEDSDTSDTPPTQDPPENDDAPITSDIVVQVPAKRGRGRPRKNPVANVNENFLTQKEEQALVTSENLRAQGIISDPGEPFEASDRKEIEGLLARGAFDFEQFDHGKHGGKRVFKSRMVREVKGQSTSTPFEKSRLVIQAYNDDGKQFILTQSPTIQRSSQRIIVALAPTFLKENCHLWLRDITQAYIQSATELQRIILSHLPVEIKDKYPAGTIMIVRKPLYGVAEAGTHWNLTYSRHHRDKLHMKTSTFDPCLLISTEKERFGIVGMQTDDTLGLSDDAFSALEEDELVKAGFMAKAKETLTTSSNLQFNGCVLSLNANGTMSLTQNGQGKKLEMIDTSTDFKQQYVQQRARGAYIASICQPEAAFALSTAAQHQEPTIDDAKALNNVIEWQMNNQDRGIQYIPLILSSAKVYVFVDGSFANNKDLSSQIGFEIIVANETAGNEEFTINGNIIHWSSTKSKRVTRSVLASEIYAMVAGADMAHAITSSIKMITDQLAIPVLPMVICTDSYSLYECLVKLGTTKEKRLMIDIMALRQSYERREFSEVRWISGLDNPADAMTKATPNRALETFMTTNQLRVRVEGWVNR